MYEVVDDGKTCETCSMLRLSKNKCIDFTCWRGFVDGDHDGYKQGKPTNIEDIKSPYEVTEEDYYGSIG